MSKELDAARELVKMLEEKEKLNKVQLGTLPIGAIFKIGDYRYGGNSGVRPVCIFSSSIFESGE